MTDVPVASRDKRAAFSFDAPEREADTLMTGEAVALDVRPAGFILRAAGGAIDFLISVALFIVLVLGLGALASYTDMDAALGAALSVASLVLCFVVVPVTVEVLMKGRSVGKLAIGARVVRDDGGAITLRHSIIRSLTGMLEIYSTLGALATIVALLNGKSKRLGDLLAGTYSQHERVPAPVSHARGVPATLQSWAQVADVARLPDRLALRVSQFLAQAPGLSHATRERLAHELAAEATPFVSPIPQVHPALFLAGIAAVRRDREYAALTLQKERLDSLDPILQGLPHGFPNR